MLTYLMQPVAKQQGFSKWEKNTKLGHFASFLKIPLVKLCIRIELTTKKILKRKNMRLSSQKKSYLKFLVFMK